MVAIDIGTFFDTVLAWLQNTWTSLCADFYLNFIKEDRWKYLVRGLGVTLEVALFAAIAGIILGALLAIVRTTADKTGRLRFLNWLAKLYITVIRGTPVVVQLLIINFVIFSSVFVDTVLVAIIAFGLNSAAYVAEVFRSGIMSIDEGQFEAGRSLGFNYGQTMWHIVMPQAFKNVLPALANEFITLLKETSVSGYIGLMDLTKAGDIIRSRTFAAFMPLIAVALVYLIMVVVLSAGVSRLERRLRNGTR
ncbi:MAG: amino acid ABC transporter permease [Christensenellaceae bacterium]|jgi:His/Glu/Gln/Arg/opine family amino acid ABC transporter permease subunit|nr:amino acid ABC transporter permease [Christensenellaceae bacterium]MBS5879825.1 amino acid ABC transporter permease [Clostridium sp.]MCI5915267.1 amino acid ABC transporter permease [Christensenella sp.]